jgi:3-oxoacyl-(acyl-carrier-protein) synthase
VTEATISGTGCITCAGNSPQDLLAAALSGQHGLSTEPKLGLTLGFTNESVIPSLRQAINDHPYSRTLFPNGIPEGPRAKPLVFLYSCLFAAMKEAKWTQIPKGTGVVFATTTGYVPFWEDDLVDFHAGNVSEQDFTISFQDHPLSRPLDPLFQTGLVEGPLRIVTSACAAGTQALAIAYQWIATGKVERCIVAGTELLSTLTIRGFNSLSLISKKPCAPFDMERDGINLSEAAGAIILERSDLAKTNLATLSGGGMSLDSYDMTSPDPSGLGIVRAIEAAMKKAGASAQNIDWIHTHGTGSQANDIAEAAAISQIFGRKSPPVSSTKGLHGHALAVSGIIETILCIGAMNKKMIIGTLNHKQTDEKIKARIQKENVSCDVRTILKTTLGFGGVNAAIVLTHSAETY